MEVTIIRKVELSMDEQKKYEVIKSLADQMCIRDRRLRREGFPERLSRS